MADEPTPQDAPPERPEWLPEQFQTPEALAESYQNLRAESDRMRNEMQRDRESFTAALETFQQQPAPPPQNGYPQQQFDPAMSAYTQAMEVGDYQAALQAQAQFNINAMLPAVANLMKEEMGALTPAVQAAQAAERENSIRLAEGLVEREIGTERYASLAPKISELQQENKFLPQAGSVETYASAIRHMVKLADYDRLAKAELDWEQERVEKLGAQTLTTGYNRPTVDQDAARADFERVKNTPTGSFEEMMARGRQGG